MVTMIKGIDITLYTDSDTKTVSNVLVGEPATSEGTLSYTLAIPKGDSHIWTDKKVSFFNKTFRTIGYPVEGIEENLPLLWNKQIKVELLITNGNCTFFEKDTFTKHVFSDVLYQDLRGEAFTKSGEQKKGDVNIHIYAVNHDDFSYTPKSGDIVVFGECDFIFDTSSQQTASVSMKSFRELYPGYAVVSTSEHKICGTLPDYIITAR